MRIICIAVLALVPALAQADWVKVAETRDTIYYVDPATIRTDGSVRNVWEIQDFAEKRPSGARSRHALFEFDCSAERWRVLSIADHAEPMAAGKILGSWEGQSDWASLTPRTGSNIASDTTGRTILRYVCSL